MFWNIKWSDQWVIHRYKSVVPLKSMKASFLKEQRNAENLRQVQGFVGTQTLWPKYIPFPLNSCLPCCHFFSPLNHRSKIRMLSPLLPISSKFCYHSLEAPQCGIMFFTQAFLFSHLSSCISCESSNEFHVQEE